MLVAAKLNGIFALTNIILILAHLRSIVSWLASFFVMTVNCNLKTQQPSNTTAKQYNGQAIQRPSHILWVSNILCAIAIN